MNSRQISLLAAFLDAGIEFAVVGGMAVNAYGYVRATDDLDVFVAPSYVQAAYDVVEALGWMQQLLMFDNGEGILRLGPEEDHIELLASMDEMPFEQVWRNRMEAVVDGLKIPFISKADLIENKRKVGRLRDLADVEELERIPDFDLF